jgi:hypothetical protein
MDVTKIGTTLCLAFQISDGPFNVIVKYEQSISKLKLSKDEVKKLSMDPSVMEIDISSLVDDRRSKERWTKVRRVKTRNILKGFGVL